MIRRGTEMLLVDDSAAHVELTLHALKERASVGDVHVARDGEEALNFLFCLGDRETVYTLGEYWLRVNLAPPWERTNSGEL